MGTPAVGKHPTGMHSSFHLFILKITKFVNYLTILKLNVLFLTTALDNESGNN